VVTTRRKGPLKRAEAGKPQARLVLPRSLLGFTLVEVLVVIVLIGVLAGSALLSVGLVDAAPQVRQETQRLADVAQRAADFALFRSVPTALQLTRSGYRVVVRREGGWQRFDGDDHLMKAHEFGAGVRASVADGLGGWNDAPELMLAFDVEGLADPAIIRLQDDERVEHGLVSVGAGASVSVAFEPANGS
jgi:type II secretion system protein H